MNKQFIAIIIVVTLGLFALFSFTKNSNENGQSGSTNAQTTNHTKGAGNKGVTLIEYGDLQCPACKQYYPIVKQLEKEYKDEITIQFRHYPLTQIHPHAFEAARAAEAAGKQGKFFEMHDLMYENQESWSQAPNVSAIFEEYAKQLELDIEQYKADKSSEEVAATINADTKAGQDIGARSTPTFVLNGEKLEPNPRSLDEFKEIIDQAIARSGQQ